MTNLIKNLQKELNKQQLLVEKLEVKYNNSKNEKNEFWGDDNIYKLFMKSIEARDIISNTIEKLNKLN